MDNCIYLQSKGYCDNPYCRFNHPPFPTSLNYIAANTQQYIEGMIVYDKQNKFPYRHGIYCLLRDKNFLLSRVNLFQAILSSLKIVQKINVSYCAKLISLKTDELYTYVRYLFNNGQKQIASKIILQYNMNSSEFGKLQNQKILNEGNYFVRQLNGKVKIDLIICYLKNIDTASREVLLASISNMYGSDFEMVKNLYSLFNLQPKEYYPQTNERLKRQKLYIKANQPIKHCYEIPSNVTVTFIDQIQDFSTALTEISKNSYLGFDSEWPALSLFKNKPSIIQIATREKIWIFDLLALYVPANYQTLESYYSLLNKNKIKQFWLGGAGDMRNLKKHYSRWPSLFCTDYHYDIHEYLAKKYNKDLKISLKSLAYIFTGMVMDKGQCLSDWTKRPLSEPQIKYAALDSYIEVIIYEISEKYKTWEEMDPNIVKRYEAMIKNKNEKRERRHHQKEKEQSKEVQPQTQTILCSVQDDSSSDEFINEDRNEISSDSDPC